MTRYNQCQHDPSCRAKQSDSPDAEFAKRFVQAAKDLGSDIYNSLYEGVKQSNQIHEQLCGCNNSANQNQSSESENKNNSKQSSTENQSGQSKSTQAGNGSQQGSGRASSQIDRAAFKAEREAFWKAEAKAHPEKYSAEDLAKMQKGRAPTGLRTAHWSR